MIMQSSVKYFSTSKNKGFFDKFEAKKQTRKYLTTKIKIRKLNKKMKKPGFKNPVDMLSIFYLDYFFHFTGIMIFLTFQFQDFLHISFMTSRPRERAS